MNELPFIAIPAQKWEMIEKSLQFMETEILAMKQKQSKEFLTFKETCEKLKCSRNTLQNYVDAGKIKPLVTSRKIYNKVLFRNADILYFLQNDKRN